MVPYNASLHNDNSSSQSSSSSIVIESSPQTEEDLNAVARCPSPQDVLADFR
jgi:hypothetical protein